MDLTPYRAAAERALSKGAVRTLEFFGSTYQVEVYDAKAKESFWPLLQFDAEEQVQDAFCSCADHEEGGCLHLALAHLALYQEKAHPLHVRFAGSFWELLFAQLADQIGYDPDVWKKQKEGSYVAERESEEGTLSCILYPKTAAGRQLLSRWIEERPQATPENSIKFSNFSREEILWWREGRPGPALRYALSCWSDLAKWLLIQEDHVTLFFEEDAQGLPTRLTLTHPLLTIYLELTEALLEPLIPLLPQVGAPLTVSEKAEVVRYDPAAKTLLLESLAPEGRPARGGGKGIGRWLYYSGRGFVPRLDRGAEAPSLIDASALDDFLDTHQTTLSGLLVLTDPAKGACRIDPTPHKVRYAMHFDAHWNWHFSAYLFEKGDLQQPEAALFGRWAYLPTRGFVRITELRFPTPSACLSPEAVSPFVSQQRIWLHEQEGFRTHLAHVDASLSYRITEKKSLLFYSATELASRDFHNFGEWVYYAGEGFFPTKSQGADSVLRPGLEIPEKQIPLFLQTHREELENLPHFFTTTLPLSRRGLSLTVHSSTSLHVKPLYEGAEGLLFFGDVVFQKGVGFTLLPLEMRLPEGYQQERTISQEELSLFFHRDFPLLKPHLLHLDPALTPVTQCDLEVRYLVRTRSGGVKVELAFHTERGTIPLSTLLEGYAHRRHYLFTEGGLVDLQDERFLWIRKLPEESLSPSTVSLSTLDFLRLDATFSLRVSTEASPTATMTRNLLRELRTFTTQEPANTQGLSSTLRPYQSSGVQWLWFLYKNHLSGLLCDDMGLGKTHQAMALMAAIVNQKGEGKRRFLVVAPTSVIYHWQDKLALFLPHLPVHTFHGNRRSLEGFGKEGILLTTYGILRVEKKTLAPLLFDVAIFDEIQVAKNPSSRIHEALKHIHARMRLGLTGTPIENNLTELKALFDIVLPGYMPSEARYRTLFLTPIEQHHDQEKRGLLSQLIRPFTLRRRKSEVLQELPEKSEDKSYCDLSPQQKQLYQKVLDREQALLISQLRERDEKVNYVHIFALLSRLKQVCNHPVLLSEEISHYKKYSSGKWDLFVELLQETQESGQKVVVFSQYLHMLDIIEQHLQEKGWGYAQIRGETRDRREELRRFQEDPSCVVFLGSLQAAGLGIDLTAASVVILYDRWWNAARENQAIDRVHRIGQKWGVQVYKLITKGTIEEKIDLMISKKGRLLEEVVTSDDQATLKTFTRSELIELLQYHDEEGM